MLRLLVAFTTYDGHTAKIAERISVAVGQADCAVEVCDLARSRPEQSLKDSEQASSPACQVRLGRPFGIERNALGIVGRINRGVHCYG